MGKPTGHHWITKSYLNGFIDPNNKPYIWMYEKGKNIIKQSTPSNICKKKNYHTIRKPDGSKDSESIENMLAQYEDKAVKILRKIETLQPITKEEKGYFTFFIALHRTRIPIYRKKIENQASDLFNIIRIFQNNYTNNIISKESLDTDFKDVFKEKLKQTSLEIYLSETSNIALDIAQLKWSFLTTSGSNKFVTSDNPVYYHNSVNPNQISIYNANIEVTFPLTKDTAFLGTRKREEGYYNANDDLVDIINIGTIMSASRFVFASQNTQTLSDLVQKYSNIRPH